MSDSAAVDEAQQAAGLETLRQPDAHQSVTHRVDSGRVDSGRVDSGRVDSGRVDSGQVDTLQPRSGVLAVDDALARLVALDELPVDQHPAVFESVHGSLRGVLGSDGA